MSEPPLGPITPHGSGATFADNVGQSPPDDSDPVGPGCKDRRSNRSQFVGDDPTGELWEIAELHDVPESCVARWMEIRTRSPEAGALR